MKIISSIRDGVERVVDLLSFSIFLILIIVGVYAIFDVKNVESSAKLDEEVLAAADEIKKNNRESFTELQEINPEIMAWIEIDDTHVSFPIAYNPHDNSKYLTHDYKLEFATAGNPFIDYRNDRLNDDFTIIYGHRMSGTLMFSDVTKFEDKAYFADHKTGHIYTPDKNYKFDILLFAKPVVANTKIYELRYTANGRNDEILDMLEGDIVNKRPDINITKDSKLALISTCDKVSHRVRNVLLVELHEEPQEGSDKTPDEKKN